MKRFILAIGLILLGTAIWAQPEKREDRLKAYRVAIFTEVLPLTPEEAEGFWPIYNEYQDKREALQEQLKPSKKLDVMSDEEVEQQVKRHFEMRQRDLDLEKELYQKLRSVIPLRKIVKIPDAEKEFREQLLIKLREARAKRQQAIRNRRN